MDFFRKKYTWSKLERLMDLLPSNSRFRVAMAEDDELAEEILNQGRDTTGAGKPKLADVDFKASILMLIADRLDQLAATVVGVMGGKPSTPTPLPRPEYALDRVERRLARQQAESLNAEVYAAMERYDQLKQQ